MNPVIPKLIDKTSWIKFSDSVIDIEKASMFRYFQYDDNKYSITCVIDGKEFYADSYNNEQQ